MKSGSMSLPALAVIVAAAGTALAIDVTRPGDLITPSSLNSPGTEGVANAIDNTGRTKYLNFDEINTGFTVTPSGVGVVRNLTILTANDAPARDPASYTLEGSDDGTTFTMIASGAISPTTDRRSLASVAFANSTTYAQYRVRFPTVRDSVSANSMQVAEVQLNTSGDITSPFDAISVTYTPGASSPVGMGVLNLIDNKLATKFNVTNGNLGPTTVDITPLAGATVATGFYYASSDNDAFAGRTPRNVTISGSNDGVSFTQIFTTPLADAGDTFQDQEFDFPNVTSYTQYRIVFDIPASATDMQVGEFQLYGVSPGAVPPANDECANARIIAAGDTTGTTDLGGGSDITPCGINDSIDVWFRYTATASGPVEASTCTSSADTTLAVYAGCGGALIACDADSCFKQSIVRWNAVSGSSYIIRLADENGATGPYRLTINTAPETHSDTPLGLRYNFNGMVHNGEGGQPDAPDGFRGISDRALMISSTPGSIGAGTTVGRTRIRYDLIQSAGTLDIVNLGDRNTVDNGNWHFDAVVDGDNIGIQPSWLADTNQSGPQVTDLSDSSILMGANTRIGVLYQASNGGGFFDLTLTFDDQSFGTVRLEAPDWFFDQSPGDPGFGVEAQAQLGVFLGAENTDNARTGASLNVVEAIVSTQSLIDGGIGDFNGRRLSSLSFSNRSSLISDFAIIAASVRDAGVACPCNWNGDAFLNSQDFFDFLNSFFSGSGADFNHDGITNSQDFFDFLNCFFTPPQGC